MPSETRGCQNCKNSFVIEPDDFSFYDKMKVPAPTWCPECRLVRRLMFRNDRSLYKRKCDLCHVDILAMYPPDSKFQVYCRECWYSDKWDGTDHGQEVDLSRNFFLQMKEVYDKAPRLALFQINPVNSPFANGLLNSKNVYLSYSILTSENVMYSKSIDKSSMVLDSAESLSLDQCYENIDSEKNYNSHFMLLTWNCIDSWFLYDSANCKNCFMSANLRNKEYVIRNKQYSKEEYHEELKKMNLGSAKALASLKQEYDDMRGRALHKFANILKSENSSGHNISNAKNSRNSFEVYNTENTKYVYRLVGVKDSMDVSYSAMGEMKYEHTSGGNPATNLRFSLYVLEDVYNAEYVSICKSSTDLFGCVGLKNKKHCILNKQYSPQEFGELREKIIENMNSNPYVDPQGRTWKYGEFFPLMFADPFGYNETVAQELFQLTKEEILARGYPYKDMGTKTHSATRNSENLPDSIKDVEDSILEETIACAHGGNCNEQCTSAFRVIPDELQFYRQKNLPIPHLCPNCRYYERLKRMEPLRLWKRQCQCAGTTSQDKSWKNSGTHSHGETPCPNDFQSPYSPERPEAVYCEGCYQAEVM